MNRLLTLLFAWGLLAGPTFGQAVNGSSAPVPTEYEFCFVADNDMFFVPWSGNGAELERLTACVAQHKEGILAGSIPALVDGYCTSQATAAENLAMAKTRSNCVKSELILRQGLTEGCFTTQNHASDGNFVSVRLVIPTEPSDAELEAQRRAEAERLAAEKRAEEARLAAEQDEAVPPVLEQAREEEPAPSSLSVRANLLRWATLTPDLGVEWRFADRWSVAVNGSWTSWTWRDNDRRYALWEVAPEVRCYLGEKRAWYVGAMFKAGQFNYKLSDTGRQGDLMGGGLTGGYVLPLGKCLALDFSLGLGYLNADYEKYEVIDGVRVRRGSGTKGWWGPINAGITLKWNLF